MNKRINLNDPTAWSEFDWIDPVVPEVLKRTDAQVNVARANRLRAQDPGLEKKRKEKFYKKMSDPNHQKKLLESNQQVALKLLKPILTPEGVFPSKKVAAAHYQKILGKESPNSGNNYISYKLKTDKENYHLITKEEYAKLKKD
jgi:hypothetical protein